MSSYNPSRYGIKEEIDILPIENIKLDESRLEGYDEHPSDYVISEYDEFSKFHNYQGPSRAGKNSRSLPKPVKVKTQGKKSSINSKKIQKLEYKLLVKKIQLCNLQIKLAAKQLRNA